MVLLAGLFGLGAHGLTAATLGDADRGEAHWNQCAKCHMVGQSAENRVGPHLNELIGRRAATIDGYRYSKAMQRAGADGLVWTPETIDQYVANPKVLVTGTRMSFRGIDDAAARADLIAYLQRYSVSPADLPEGPATAVPTDPDVNPEILAIVGDPAYGQYLASECVTCHQASGADLGIPSIVGWPKDDFVIAMQAYKAQVRLHPVMRLIAGRLADEEIAALAAYFEGVE